ncbi:unnamed protein product [Brassica napus]|uniref:(rape) hypothetical protein n=1 Tax=Brassica napus TaxID=3708 RepID=A0A816KIT7_BRANA|nr:unnamed protein product [Brassica napus]
MCHNVSLERSSGDDEFEIIYLRRQEQSHYTFQNVGSSSKFSTTMFPIWVFFVYHEAMANMKTEFMALWDRFSTDHKVMVLAATNRPSELDEAIMRRLPQAFEIGMPERKERAEILKVTLKGERVEPDIDYDHLARLCEGYTGSDIFELCKKEAYFPIREILEEERKWRPCPLILATSKKTQAAAGEYCGLRWSREPDEVEAAISGISKLLVSQFINLQSGSQDKTIHVCL